MGDGGESTSIRGERTKATCTPFTRRKKYEPRRSSRTAHGWGGSRVNCPGTISTGCAPSAPTLQQPGGAPPASSCQ